MVAVGFLAECCYTVYLFVAEGCITYISTVVVDGANVTLHRLKLPPTANNFLPVPNF